MKIWCHPSTFISNKASSPDSVCPERVICTGAGLKSWLIGFLYSRLRYRKILNVWRRVLVVTFPKPKNSKIYLPISLLFINLYEILEPASNLSLTLCSHRHRRAFRTESTPLASSKLSCSSKSSSRSSRQK